MIDLTLIGIGTGSPGHLTREAVAAMELSDLILIPSKGADKADLGELREMLCRTLLPRPPVLARFDMPERTSHQGYRQGVEDWHDAIAEAWEAVIRRHGAIRPALLVWGDPSLYDSTLRIAERVRRRLALNLRVVPGITAVQALCAAHRIPLNAVAEPVQITTGRNLRAQGWPESIGRIVVMLDGDCAFQTLPAEGTRIWWGAFLGMAEQILIAGPLAEAGPQILAQRAAARAAHGWIMDIYLLAREG